MPFLRLYSGETLQRELELGSKRINIGRAPDNDIVLHDPAVSKHHAHIETDGHDYILVDDGSANGVFVNKRRISRHTLAFWDEIQIHSYRLVFMSTQRLPGDVTRTEVQPQPSQETSKTVLLRESDIAALRKKLEKSRVAYLTILDSGVRVLLDKPSFRLGRARDCDLRCGGWFAPRLAATIEQRQDGYYLVPAKRVRVFVNGEYPRDPVRLLDNSDLRVQGMVLKYYFRPIERG